MLVFSNGKTRRIEFMREVKTENRAEKSFDSFFEAENQTLDLANSSEISANQAFTENPLLNLLKQVFLFLPGTLLLYLIGFIGTIVLIDSFFVSESREIFGITSAPLQMILFGIIILFGTFMTWFGLGDIKNKKHIAIPTSILLTGGILAAISKILGDVFGFTGFFEMMNYYFIYLFPLVLIVPVLVKSWIDRKPEN